MMEYSTIERIFLNWFASFHIHYNGISLSCKNTCIKYFESFLLIQRKGKFFPFKLCDAQHGQKWNIT